MEVDVVTLASYAGAIGVTALAAYYKAKAIIDQARTQADKFLAPTSVVRKAMDDLDDALHDDKVSDTEFVQMYHDFYDVYNGVKTAITKKSVAPLTQ